MTDQRVPAQISVRVRLARVDGAFERVLGVLARKRVRLRELHLTSDANIWTMMLEAEVDADRSAHVVAVLEREPLVLAVNHVPEVNG